MAITPMHWAQTAGLVLLMSSSIGGACAIIKFYEDSGIRLLAVSVALLIVYICCRWVFYYSLNNSAWYSNVLAMPFIRFLGLNTIMAYQRAKVSAFKIVSTRAGQSSGNDVGELSMNQDLAFNGGTRQDERYVSSPTSLPTSEMWKMNRNDLDSRSSSQWKHNLRESLVYLVAAICLAYTLRSVSPRPCFKHSAIFCKSAKPMVSHILFLPLLKFVYDTVPYSIIGSVSFVLVCLYISVDMSCYFGVRYSIWGSQLLVYSKWRV